MMRFIFCTLALLITFSAARAEEATITQSVKDNIHVIISPMGGNVTVSDGSDGAFIIDDQLTTREQIIKDAVKKISGKNIKFILNTHYHFDHTGGNEVMGSDGAVIIAQDNVRKRLSTKQFITHFKKEMPALSEKGLPVVTFANDLTVHYNNDDIHVIHVPSAHTDGDVIAHFTKSNVLVAGDIVFNGLYPFIDIEHGGSIKGVLAAVDVLLSLADNETRIIPGHGDVMGKAELQSYQTMLKTVATSIEDQIKAGKTRKDIIAAKPTKEFDAVNSGAVVAPDDFVGILYDSLTQDNK